MTEKSYSNAELFRIARSNYETLLAHCLKLHTEGYWSQPGQMLKQTVQESLDIYLQSFLLLFAAQYQQVQKAQLEFLGNLTDTLQLGITSQEELSEKMLMQAQKIMSAPPILLQLCALRDREKKTQLAVIFMDTVLNIIIAMSYLDHQNGTGLVRYLHQYFQQIEAFLSKDMQYLLELDEAYLHRKVASPVFETGYAVEMLAGEHTDENEHPDENAYADENEHADENAYADEIEHSDENAELLKTETEKQETSNCQGEENNSETLVQPDREEVRREFLKLSASHQDSENRHIKTIFRRDAVKNSPCPDADEIAKATAQAKLELEQTKDAKKAAVVETLMEELDELVGLASVKEEMRSLVNLIKVRKMRANYNMPQMDMSYHMVFTGNAGTGKTTVARMVAEIYKELGVLSKGTFVETDRAGLVAGYLGQTAMKVKEVVERAKGGVLFIDEAYSLVSRDAADDYGIEAIDTLVKEMEDNRNDLVVIVAGYREEMEYFLKSNTGLVSRFNKYIEFSDYSNDQLIEIMIMMAKKAAMTIEEDAVLRVRDYLNQMSAQERNDFGNARGIRNIFERIVTNQANRLIAETENPDMEALSIIKAEDVII